MNDLFVVFFIMLAYLAISFWESSVEGRNAWDKGKHGWKIKFRGKTILTRYHFFLFYIMVPVFLSLPLVISGWDSHVFGVLLFSFFLGSMLEDFMWYVINPKVKFKEFKTEFSDYYPWFKIAGKKIVPLYYLFSTIAAIATYIIFW